MLLRILAFAILAVVLSAIQGCASGPPQTFMQRATAQTREVLEFNPCPYGVEDATLSSHAEVNTTYTSDPALRSYQDYSRHPYGYGETQYYKAPREVTNKAAGGQRTNKCKPPPGLPAKKAK